MATLNDDISSTSRKILRGALKGLVIGAVAALVIGTGIGAYPILLEAVGMATNGAIGAGLLHAGIGIAAAATTTATQGIGMVLTGAAAGAALFGIGSVIPGPSEWFGLKKLFKRDSAEEATRAPVHNHTIVNQATAQAPVQQTAMQQASMRETAPPAPIIIHEAAPAPQAPIIIRETTPAAPLRPTIIVVRERPQSPAPEPAALPQPVPAALPAAPNHIIVVQQSASSSSTALPTPAAPEPAAPTSVVVPVVVQQTTETNPSAAPEQSSAALPAAPDATDAAYNPYFKPGLGAQLLQKNEAASQQGAGTAR